MKDTVQAVGRMIGSKGVNSLELWPTAAQKTISVLCLQAVPRQLPVRCQSLWEGVDVCLPCQGDSGKRGGGGWGPQKL